MASGSWNGDASAEGLRCTGLYSERAAEVSRKCTRHAPAPVEPLAIHYDGFKERPIARSLGGSLEQGHQSMFHSRISLFLVLLGLVILGIVAIFFVMQKNPGTEVVYPFSFDGSSDELQKTVIVPTLDTPIPEGKSAIWCASFQMSWNKLKTEVGQGPIKIKGAQEIADRLNQAEQSEDDLNAESSYSAAGLIKEGIIEKIQADMAQKFPDAAITQFRRDPDDVAIAYGYLKAEVKFKHAFLENEDPAAFMVEGEDPTRVRFFGVPRKAVEKDLRDQVEVKCFDLATITPT
jgi:hypothetical protein